jgi:hypothetical protein
LEGAHCATGDRATQWIGGEMFGYAAKSSGHDSP